MFFSQFEELFHVLNEIYALYRIKPDRPAQQAQGGYSEDSLTKNSNNCFDYFSKFLLTQVFCAAAPENVRCLISHKDQTRLTKDDAYQVFFTKHCIETDKKISVINAIQDDQEASNAETDISAFCPQTKQ